MKLLTTSWAGRAEHGILEVNAEITKDTITFIFTDSYYNDAFISKMEKQNIFEKTYDISGMTINKKYLYEKILENLPNGYTLKLEEIEFDL